MVMTQEAKDKIAELSKHSAIVKMFEEAICSEAADEEITMTFTRGELLFTMLLQDLAMCESGIAESGTKDKVFGEMVKPMIAFLGIAYGEEAMLKVHHEGKKCYEMIWDTDGIVKKLALKVSGNSDGRDPFFEE